MKKIALFKHPIKFNLKALKNKKIVIFNVALLVLIVVLGVIGYVRFWNVATVNGVPISRIAYIKSLEKQGGKQVLDSMIDDALVLNEGKAKGVNVDQKTIDDEIATIEAQLKNQGQTLDSALLASGMVKADLEKQIKIQKIESVLSATKTEITQVQIDDFLTTNKAQLPTGKTKAELEDLARQQLTMEASQSAATTWLDNLRSSAKIIYK
jgi:parvulin-like peptidyl-prolyl isomerase